MEVIALYTNILSVVALGLLGMTVVELYKGATSGSDNNNKEQKGKLFNKEENTDPTADLAIELINPVPPIRGRNQEIPLQRDSKVKCIARVTSGELPKRGRFHFYLNENKHIILKPGTKLFGRLKMNKGLLENECTIPEDFPLGDTSIACAVTTVRNDLLAKSQPRPVKIVEKTGAPGVSAKRKSLADLKSKYMGYQWNINTVGASYLRKKAKPMPDKTKTRIKRMIQAMELILDEVNKMGYDYNKFAKSRLKGGVGRSSITSPLSEIKERYRKVGVSV